MILSDVTFLLCFLFLISINAILLHLFISKSSYLGLQDVPNERSSHNYQVVRGGGFLFTLNWIVCAIFFGEIWTSFNVGLFLLFLIGIWDDFRSISAKIRLVLQFLAVLSLMVYYGFDFKSDFIWMLVLMILFVYVINVFNFMDGINGMLGFYGWVLVSTLHFGLFQSTLSLNDPYFWLSCAILVFLFFNARNKAKIFSGDVGSLTMAYLLIPVLFHLDHLPNDSLMRFNEILGAILSVSVFMLDSFTTIVHRLLLGEDIFKSHRFHLYQIVTPRLIPSHILTASLYAFSQFLIIMCSYHVTTSIESRLFFITILVLLFFLLRYLLLKKTTIYQ